MFLCIVLFAALAAAEGPILCPEATPRSFVHVGTAEYERGAGIHVFQAGQRPVGLSQPGWHLIETRAKLALKGSEGSGCCYRTNAAASTARRIDVGDVFCSSTRAAPGAPVLRRIDGAWESGHNLLQFKRLEGTKVSVEAELITVKNDSPSFGEFKGTFFEKDNKGALRLNNDCSIEFEFKFDQVLVEQRGSRCRGFGSTPATGTYRRVVASNGVPVLDLTEENPSRVSNEVINGRWVMREGPLTNTIVLRAEGSDRVFLSARLGFKEGHRSASGNFEGSATFDGSKGQLKLSNRCTINFEFQNKKLVVKQSAGSKICGFGPDHLPVKGSYKKDE